MSAPSNELAMFLEEIVLLLGGVCALESVSEKAVLRIAIGLRRAYQRAQHRQARREQVARAPHPAFSQLLRLVRARQRTGGAL